jgi:hypothetical protein
VSEPAGPDVLGPSAPSNSGSGAPGPTIGFRARVRRIIDYWFPPSSGRPRRADGLLSSPGPDRWALLVACLIAGIAAIAFEWFISSQPVPPGGDEGTWLLLSYPYVGIHYPASIAPFSYPPISFPFLGAAVVVASGPLLGARIYSGLLVAGMGLAMYSLGRSMFQLRIVALLIEVAFFVQPDFQQLYYFGAYPNMFGFIFFFLSVGYAIRFLRSRRPEHLAVFWVATTLAVLSEALVAVTLVALLIVAGLILLLFRRLPKQFFASRTGLVGAIGFVAASAAYYVGVVVTKINAPNYLSTGSLAQSTSATLIPTVLRPFYLESLAKGIDGSGFSLSESYSLELIVGSTIVLLGVVLALRWFFPRTLSHRWVFLIAWVVAIFGVTEASYFGNLGGDYRRLAYFLYPFTLLGAGVFIDLFLTWLVPGTSPGAPTTPAIAADGTGRRRSWTRPRSWSRRQGVFALLVTLGFVGLLASSVLYTVPNAQAFELSYTAVGHDADFVSAMQSVSASGLPGTIFSTTEGVDRWPATLTSRNLYEVRSPTGFTYSSNEFVLDELANIVLADRFAVTNARVAALIPGFNNTTVTAAPQFDVYWYGVLNPVFTLAPDNVFVTLEGHGAVSAYPDNVGPVPELELPSNASNASLGLVFNQSGFQVIESIVAPPDSDLLDVSYRVVATGSEQIVGVKVKISSTNANFDQIGLTGPTSFTWLDNTTAENFTSFVNASAGASLTKLVEANNTTGRGASLTVNTSSPSVNGSPSLSLGLTIATPRSSNPTSQVSGFYSSADLLRSWDVRFVLLYFGTGVSGVTPLAYFEGQYGAVPFFSKGEWEVLVLSTSLSAP